MAEADFKEHHTNMDNEANPGTSSVSTAPSSTATTTISTSSSRTPQPQISVYSGPDRHAVQVIQQALHRPPSSAAQYLQQMYAAQQQHLMLHTAALQQQHLSSSQLQSLAAVQASLSSGRPSTSPTGSVTQQSSMSQTSINLSTSPTPAQLISRSQASSTTSSSITQQTMLLGSTSPTLTASQAQMYLRAQMVQNLTLCSQKLGVLSSSQNGPPKSSSQAQSLTICHNKTTVTSSKTSQRDASPESSKKGESPSMESRSTAVTRTSSIHQLIAPASYSPIQPHSLIKHQQIPLHSPPSKVSHHQLILQQQQQQQQQVQPLPLQSPSQDPPASQHCVPVPSHGLSAVPSGAQAQHCSPLQSHPPPLPVSPPQPQAAQQSVVVSPPPPHSPSPSPAIIIHPQALIQPHPLVSSALQPGPSLQQPPTNQVQPAAQPLNLPSHLPLPASPVVHLGAVQQSSLVSPGPQIVSPTAHQPYSSLQSPPIPLATPPQLSTSPPAQVPALPLQSVQPEILSQGQVLVQNALVSEEELPAAEALVQLPFQTLPPPQTVAVNLQVQPPAPVEPPVGMHLNQCHLHKVFSLKVYQVEDVCEEEMPEESDECVRMDRTPPPPTLSPAAITVGRGEDLSSEHPLLDQVDLPAVASVSASVIKSPTDPPHASVPPPPLLLPAPATRSHSTSLPSSVPNVENRPPQAIVKPQILTHVIEGFVIQEGLEPFPVSRSSLLVEQPVKKRPLLDNTVMSGMCVQAELQNNTKHADNSSDTEMEDMAAEEGLEEMDSELLKCEFCGKMGYANEFLRSKRFCTMSCAKRYNVSCSKKFALSRWNRKPDNQSLAHSGRRPSGPDGAAREHFPRQLPITYPSAEEGLAPHEEPVPTAMITRLRRQSERERERELREGRLRKMPDSSDLLPVAQTEPSIWTVDEVWAFIHSLPGMWFSLLRGIYVLFLCGSPGCFVSVFTGSGCFNVVCFLLLLPSAQLGIFLYLPPSSCSCCAPLPADEDRKGLPSLQSDFS
ncbi:polyhomeotic-like protein 3 isoform X5 [Notamacropus eugenii]|uniref:polyhomeotic-like protein 3 isoform X5 n=1 Tax=Notamacropus eugenii TaxID=9315 RepID=UPI003B6814B9